MKKTIFILLTFLLIGGEALGQGRDLDATEKPYGITKILRTTSKQVRESSTLWVFDTDGAWTLKVHDHNNGQLRIIWLESKNAHGFVPWGFPDQLRPLEKLFIRRTGLAPAKKVTWIR